MIRRFCNRLVFRPLGAFLVTNVLVISLASAEVTKTQDSLSLLHRATPIEMSMATRMNEIFKTQLRPLSAPPEWRPVADTAKFGYVLMSGLDDGQSEVVELRRTIAKNLPNGVKLVILVSRAEAASARAKYMQWIGEDRLVLAISEEVDRGGFWARDAFPVPVIGGGENDPDLIAAKYFRRFISGPVVAKSVSRRLKAESFVFVGGNLIADERGDCFSVLGRRRFGLSANDLMNAYGCKVVHDLPHVAGIGDVDEVLKPIGNGHVLTNQPSYKASLESLGYTITMLPNIPNSFRTYANALVVDNTVFMPSYGVPTDSEAQAVYEGFGYRVIPIRSNYLSDRLNGSVHCQSMAYPQMSETDLLNLIGARPL